MTLLIKGFQLVSISQVRKSADQVAHALARVTILMSDSME